MLVVRTWLQQMGRALMVIIIIISSKGTYSPAHHVQEKIIPHQRPQNERLEQCHWFCIHWFNDQIRLLDDINPSFLSTFYMGSSSGPHKVSWTWIYFFPFETPAYKFLESQGQKDYCQPISTCTRLFMKKWLSSNSWILLHPKQPPHCICNMPLFIYN